METLNDQTVMAALSKQLKKEQAHLEHVYAGPQAKLFLLMELCHKAKQSRGDL